MLATAAAEPPKIVDAEAEGDDDDGEDEVDGAEVAVGDEEGAAKKKKKKKNKKKKKAGATATGEGEVGTATGSSSAMATGTAAPTHQTDPPSVPVRLLFPSGKYPEGEWQSYKQDNLWRETSAEKREQDRLQWDMINQVGAVRVSWGRACCMEGS